MRIWGVYLLIVASAGLCGAQTLKSETQPIYLQFDRADFENRLVWLQVVNGSKWPIAIVVELPKKAHANCEKIAEIEPQYYLEEYDPTPWMQGTDKHGQKSPPDESVHPAVPKFQRVDFGLRCEIGSKRDLKFSVPFEHLARNVALYLPIEYPWQDQVVHRLYFRGIDLPKEVQKKIK